MVLAPTFRLEPRITAEYQPFDRLRLQLGYGRYHQFLTQVTDQNLADIWLPADDGIEPAYGDQFVGGIKANLSHAYNVDLEMYYRTMRNLFELDPFISLVSRYDYDALFQVGEGYAYGAELLLEKKTGVLTGFLGYTFSVTRRRQPAFNDFQYYAPHHDRTHDLSLILNYNLSRSWRLTTVFQYGTGQAYTKPNQRFRLSHDPFEGERNLLVGRFNQHRLPAYHRLDLGLTNRGRFFGSTDYELQLQLINVYKRANVWFYYYEFTEDQGVKRNDVLQIPIVLPNLSFRVNF